MVRLPKLKKGDRVEVRFYDRERFTNATEKELEHSARTGLCETVVVGEVYSYSPSLLVLLTWYSDEVGPSNSNLDGYLIVPGTITGVRKLKG